MITSFAASNVRSGITGYSTTIRRNSAASGESACADVHTCDIVMRVCFNQVSPRGIRLVFGLGTGTSEFDVFLRVCAFRSGQRQRCGARGCGNRWCCRGRAAQTQCAGLEDLVRGMPVMLGEQAHQGVGAAPAPRCGAVTRRLYVWRRANREWPRRRRYNSVSTVDHRRRPATVHRAGWRLPCRLIQVV